MFYKTMAVDAPRLILMCLFVYAIVSLVTTYYMKICNFSFFPTQEHLQDGGLCDFSLTGQAKKLS